MCCKFAVFFNNSVLLKTESKPFSLQNTCSSEEQFLSSSEAWPAIRSINGALHSYWCSLPQISGYVSQTVNLLCTGLKRDMQRRKVEKSMLFLSSPEAVHLNDVCAIIPACLICVHMVDSLYWCGRASLSSIKLINCISFMLLCIKLYLSFMWFMKRFWLGYITSAFGLWQSESVWSREGEKYIWGG